MKANYDLISDRWANIRRELPPKDKALFDFFIANLPKQAKVLDLGCGSGVPIAKLLDMQGFQVTGIDRSEKLLKKAKENVPRASFYKKDIEDYKINNIYDGIVLWDILFHLPRQEHQPILEKIYNSLSSNGLVILSSGGSEENLPPFTDFMFGVEFFYDSYPIKEFISLCKNIGFNLTKYELVNEPDGDRDKGRIGVVLSKA